MALWAVGRQHCPSAGPALPELRKASCHVSAGTGRWGQERPCLTPGKMCRFLTAATLQQKLTLLEAPGGNPHLPFPASGGTASLAGAPPPSSGPAGRCSFYVAISGSVAALLFRVCTPWGPLSPRWPRGITSSQGQPTSNLTDLRCGARHIHSCREEDLHAFGVIVVPPRGCRRDLAWGLVLRNPSVQHSRGLNKVLLVHLRESHFPERTWQAWQGRRSTR